MEESTLPKIEGLELRYSMLDDQPYLEEWLLQPGVLRGFPMSDAKEVAESAKHWISFSKYKSSLTATIDKKPVGIATICLMPYRKLAHQCLLSIIVSEEVRGKGVGTILMNNLIHLAKKYFSIEVLYLEVYSGNPAISLYRRFGFKEVGRQDYFMKDQGEYICKVVMELVL